MRTMALTRLSVETTVIQQTDGLSQLDPFLLSQHSESVTSVLPSFIVGPWSSNFSDRRTETKLLDP